MISRSLLSASTLSGCTQVQLLGIDHYFRVGSQQPPGEFKGLGLASVEFFANARASHEITSGFH